MSDAPRPNVPCSVAGCGKPYLAQGYCNTHYKRWRQHGSPTGGKIAFRGEGQAFIEIALKHQTNDCLLWPYGQTHGYGVLNFNGIKRDAYVLVCELAHGSKPSQEYEAAHSCNIKLCVSPRHLRWDTHAGNMKDSAGEAHPQAILTVEKVREIRARKHLPGAELARELGVSAATIYAIRKHKLWKHVI